MAKITFDQLISVYRNTAFDPTGNGGRIRIADASILDTLKFIRSDDVAFEDSAIRLEGDADKLEVGGSVDADISAPRLGLGLLARDMDGVIAAPANRVAAPARYYVIGERYAYNDATIPESVVRYRTVLRLVKALSEAAAFVDPHQAEATFLGPGRLRIPIIYKIADLAAVTVPLVDELETFVFEKIHKDQKTAILASNIIELCRNQPENDRFKFLLVHLRELVTKTQEGYKLFASEFSYEKIKGKTEESINDYTSKIHKTFHDIQNQVMGVPIATVIVATQLKAATKCGVEFWANLAISIGATLFVLLLSVAIYNQLMTLTTIEEDLGRQKVKLEKDYVLVAEQFLPLYAKLGKRIVTHRRVLKAIMFASWFGLALTWLIFNRLTSLQPLACF